MNLTGIPLRFIPAGYPQRSASNAIWMQYDQVGLGLPFLQRGCLGQGIWTTIKTKLLLAKGWDMAADIEKILQEVKALSPEKQQHVRQVLDEALPSTRASGPATEEEFQQQLVDAGLLREIKRHDVRQVPPQRRKRVDIQGTPLSETVIKERR